MTVEEFVRQVDQQFGFLQALGFSRDIQDSGREYCVTFSKQNVAVVITYELGSPPFVTLKDRSTRESPEWWFRDRFGLHELVQEVVGATAAIPDNVPGQAEALRRFGSSVLAGDFRVLHERQRRLGVAVEKNRA